MIHSYKPFIQRVRKPGLYQERGKGGMPYAKEEGCLSILGWGTRDDYPARFYYL